MVWDKPDFPSALEDPDTMLFDFDRDIIQSTTRNPARRFFRYLSLYNRDEYAKGLSIYMSRNSIVGLGAHFTRTSQFSGHQYGCELYFPLYDGEQIAYAWLRISSSLSPAFAEPALVVSFYQFLISLLLISLARFKRVRESTPLGRIFNHI